MSVDKSKVICQLPLESHIDVCEIDPTVMCKESPAEHSPEIVKLETLLESTLVVVGGVMVTGSGCSSFVEGEITSAIFGVQLITKSKDINKVETEINFSFFVLFILNLSESVITDYSLFQKKTVSFEEQFYWF